LAVLTESSAVPSFTAKSITPSANKAKSISKAEKVRLRRIARKELDDPVEHVGAADIKVDNTIPLSDAWSKVAPTIKKGTFGEETMVKKTVKAPKTLAEQRKMRAGRVVNIYSKDELPDDGTSYNPRAESHAALMEQAIQEELELLRREQDTEARMKELGQVVVSRKQVGRTGEFADGMLVDPLSEGEGEESGSELDPADIPLPKKQTVRKTQAQRNKVLKRRAAAEAEERERKQKQIHKSLGASAVHQIKKEAEARLKELKEKEQLAKVVRKEKERLGLEGGEKIGKYKVGKGRVEVQLGEDLAESLRQLKVSQQFGRLRVVWPSGTILTLSPRETSSKTDSSLYRRKPSSSQECQYCMSRFVLPYPSGFPITSYPLHLVWISLIISPSRRALKTKEYEKHAWKNFVV
jgi:nucleolar protein 53